MEGHEIDEVCSTNGGDEKYFVENRREKKIGKAKRK
jgi:hypothetical protein